MNIAFKKEDVKKRPFLCKFEVIFKYTALNFHYAIMLKLIQAYVFQFKRLYVETSE